MIINLLYIYLAMLIVVLLHELGHRPKKIKIIRLFPIPMGAAYDSASRYGGLIVNAALFTSVFYFKPEYLFLQLVGLVAWIHFIFYAIFGSINYEPKISKSMMKYWVFDDIPNELAFVFIPLGIFTFFYLKNYYILIFITIIQSLF